MNTPDKWAIIKFKGDDEHYRVLAGWNGSYLYGSHWRINSGITKVEEDGDHYLFHGHSGSIYKCHKNSYGLSTLTADVYLGLEKHHGDNVEVLSSNTDFMKLTA